MNPPNPKSRPGTRVMAPQAPLPKAAPARPTAAPPPAPKAPVRKTTTKIAVRPGAPAAAPAGRTRGTSQIRKGTGSMSARPAPAGGKKDGKKLWIVVGACVGGAILIAVIAAALGNSTPPPQAAEPSRPVERKIPVDVSGMVSEGEEKCEKGLAMIRSCEELYERTQRTDEETAGLRKKLKEGVELISQGMNLFERAREKAGENVADPKKEYGMARKSANAMLANLPR